MDASGQHVSTAVSLPDSPTGQPALEQPGPDRKNGTPAPEAPALPAETDGRLEMRLLADHYIDTVPSEGRQYFEQLLASGERQLARTFLRAFAHRLAERDPLALAAWIGELPESFRNEATVGLILKGSRKDLQAVGQWIVFLEDGPHKTRAVNLFGQHMEANPDNPYYRQWAWELIANTADPGPFLNVISPILARENPEFFYKLIGQMNDPHGQEQSLEGFVSVLASSRPWETLEWLQTFDNADLRRRLESRSLEALARKAPGEAAVWILAYPDSHDFEERVSRLAAVWAETDPAAARAFIHRAPLSETRRAYLFATLP